MRYNIHSKKASNRLTFAVVSILSAMALTACGGGSGGDSKPKPAPKPTNTWVLNGVVVDNYGNGIANAEVRLYLNKEYIEVTDAQGHYTINLPKDYNYPDHFAGVVTKQDYVPKTIVFSSIGNQPFIKDETAPIRVVEESDILFPASLQVRHLGDSNYSGTENSQFQFLRAQGDKWSTTAKLSAAQKSKYNQLCIQGSYKGIQNPNEIIVSNGTFSEVSTTLDTDSLGGYSELENCVSIDKFKANEELTLTIKSVKTGKTSTDIDDFEFVNVRGVLKNSNDNNADTYNLAGFGAIGHGGYGVEGIKVSVVLDGVEYSSVTDSKGHYILHLPKNIDYPEYFAGIATKQGHVPATVFFTSKNNIPEIINSDVAVVDIDPDYVAIPHSLNVVHLGDSGYEGAKNSQFQYVNAHGKTWQAVTRLNQSQLDDYSEMCLTGEFKGVESPNKIIFSTDKNAKHQLVVRTTPKTAADGSYSTLYDCFPLNKLPANKDIFVTVQSVKTGVTPTDIDDFEFINLHGELQ